MWSVHRTGREIPEERFVRSDLLGVGDELNALVGQVFRQVVTLGR
jgi:hypothetical protein